MMILLSSVMNFNNTSYYRIILTVSHVVVGSFPFSFCGFFLCEQLVYLKPAMRM